MIAAIKIISKQHYQAPLTISVLEMAYYDIVYGYSEPDVIKANDITRKTISNLLSPYKDTVVDRFNGADIITDDDMMDNRIWIGFTDVPNHFKSIPDSIPFSIIDIED